MDIVHVESLLIWPFLACLVLTGIHCYLGIHVVGRGVIFVDLALAQLAFLGSAVALTILPESHHAAVAPPTHATLATIDLSEPPADAGTEPITSESIERLIPPERNDSPARRGQTASDSPPGWTGETTHDSEQGSSHIWALRDFRPYAGGLLFTLLGAGLFSLGRFRHRHIPQEAIIGIIYAVSLAVTLVLLYKAPQDVAEQTQNMFVGQILFVDSGTVIKTAVLYAIVGLLHYLWRRPFLAISFHPQQAEAQRLAVRWWDFLFYATFGVVVTSSVQLAGVLLVFSYLIVPAVCAMLFFEGVLPRLCFGWISGFAASVTGIAASVWLDIPTGASIVATFGALLVFLLVVRAVLGIRS